MTKQEFLDALKTLDLTGEYEVVRQGPNEQIRFSESIRLSIMMGGVRLDGIIALSTPVFVNAELLMISKADDPLVVVAPFEAVTAIIGQIADP